MINKKKINGTMNSKNVKNLIKNKIFSFYSSKKIENFLY